MEAKGKALPIHPVALEYEPLSKADFKSMVESIKRLGQLKKIWRYDGQVIDGNHRQQACILLGIDPKYEDFDPKTTDPAEIEAVLRDHVAALNDERRHSNQAIRSLRATKRRLAYERSQISDATPCPVTPDKTYSAESQTEAAAKDGVSQASVSRTETVLRKGVPELETLIGEGKLQTRTAAKIAAKPHCVQKWTVENIGKGMKPGDALQAAVEKENEMAKPKQLDGEGRPVPEQWRAVFAQADRFYELSRLAARIGREAKELAETPAGKLLHLNVIVADAKNLGIQLRGSAPHAICVYCSGKCTTSKGETCPACKGHGWITKDIYEQAPDELKAKAAT